MKKRGGRGGKDGRKEEKNRLHLPACPAAESEGSSLHWVESPNKEVQKEPFNEHEPCLSLLIFFLFPMGVGWLPVGNHLENMCLKIMHSESTVGRQDSGLLKTS